jgi:hypothetical protein
MTYVFPMDVNELCRIQSIETEYNKGHDIYLLKTLSYDINHEFQFNIYASLRLNYSSHI